MEASNDYVKMALLVLLGDCDVFIYYQQGQSMSSACLSIPLMNLIYPFELRMGGKFFFSTLMVSLFDFWKYFMSTYLFFLKVPFMLGFLNQNLTNHYSSQSTFNVYCIGHLYVFPLCI